MTGESQNIRVVARIRPLSAAEKSQGCDDVLVVKQDSLSIKGDEGKGKSRLGIACGASSYTGLRLPKVKDVAPSRRSQASF